MPREVPAGRGALEALLERFPALGDPAATPLPQRFARAEIVAADGRAYTAGTPVGPGDELWFHRELAPEHVPTLELEILHHDAHLLVLDKPHDMATMPRGAHVLSSALVRLRRATGIEALVPLHRLDRRTAGVLAFGVEAEERSAYQLLFARGEVDKEYEARVQPGPATTLPTLPGESLMMRDHLAKQQGELTTRVQPGPANAETLLEVITMEPGGTLRLRLRPRTGRTHQLRAQLAARGAPILGEDLYGIPPLTAPQPAVERPSDGSPLQLLARRLAFADPFTGQWREFRSRQELEPGSRTLGP